MSFLKKPTVLLFLIIIVASSVGGYYYLGRETGLEFDSVIVSRSTVTQEVSVTGRVRAPQSIDLAFEKGGRVSSLAVAVGDLVKKGNLLVRLDSSSLSAQLLQAQAQLGVEQATLDELKRGTREEEIQVAQTAVDNAIKALADGEINLQNVKDKANVDLGEDYDVALTAMPTALDVARNAVIIELDFRRSYFPGSSQDSIAIINSTNIATSSIENNADPAVVIAVGEATDENINNALDETLTALGYTKNALDAMPIIQNMSTSDKASLNTQKSNVNAQITLISATQQDISVQKITNTSAIAAAGALLTVDKNMLASAQDTLALKQAGATPEQVTAQEAKVAAASANVQNIRAQLTKTVLYAPFDGVITEKDVQIGEIIALNKAVVSIISNAQLEIEANIPEVDISKIKLLDPSQVTLDAYGSREFFSASVSSIDPAETIIEGVATYGITLEFINGDNRIKPGMTANLDILTAQIDNVIAIPQRAVTPRNGGKNIVRIVRNGIIEEVEVVVGLRGSDGFVEILGGVNEGDEVIIFIKE